MKRYALVLGCFRDLITKLNYCKLQIFQMPTVSEPQPATVLIYTNQNKRYPEQEIKFELLQDTSTQK